MSRKVDFSLILACYNEGPTVLNSLKQIEETLEDLQFTWEIICIDDCSTDDTLGSLKKFCRNKKNFRLENHNKNLGRGGTVKEGILLARGEVVGYIDVDLEISPVYIGRFVREVKKGNDVVVALRVYKEDLRSIIRWVSSKSYALITRKIFNLKIADTEAGYKFFNRKKILPVIKKTKDEKWFFDTEIVIRSSRAGLVVKEIPVLFIRRIEKKSTVRLIPDSIGYIKALISFSKKNI